MGVTHEDLVAGAGRVGYVEGREWLLSPEPLVLSKAEGKQLESLGHPLRMFQQACDEVYRRSINGSLPGWICHLLDAGKPSWLVESQRSHALREALPRVIRPDLLLTEDGFSLTELDSVPGGMGLTGWLGAQYSAGGFEVLGGADGMIEGFRSILPKGGQVLVSEESADYRTEMEWLVEQAASRGSEQWSFLAAEECTEPAGDAYRFFELFDWEAIPEARALLASPQLTPPGKAYLEEKLWLALLWSPALKDSWGEVLRGSHLKRVRDIAPYGWVVDPTPLPPHAAIPRLEVGSWEQVAKFSQKERRLVLKISGFHELAWGSRGVVIGHDVSGEEWREALSHACTNFETEPWVLQQFHEAKLIEHPYFDPETGEVKIMQGRVRLCPYYFVGHDGKTRLGGCLAAIVPADKKKIHGMRDAILVPCRVEE
jgi:hypothetical protein